MIYSNTLETSFHFDDWLYIIDNRHVHLKELSFSKLAAAATKSPLPRPVSNISFALNYYFGRLNVFGYHLVNLLIHALAGVIIYLLLVTTLNLGSLKGRYKKRERLALIITLLWVMHPIQTQPVNYIMQRMTSLAGMFYLLSLYFYMRGRLGGTRKIRVLFYSGSMAAGLLALGSKENAGVLPLILALYEFYFFQNLDFRVIRRNWVFIIGILVIFISTAFIYLGPNVVEGVLEFYQNKDFTVGERLLTQLRVVMHYISLLFAPLPSRLNLDYDFPVSQSLFNPPSTFFSLLGLIGLVVMGVYLARRNPLVSFGVLWFLGNLVVESSVVGLEMVFEHRLYLPSLGLFLLIEGIDRRKVNERAFIYGAFTVLLLLAFWAIQRNTVWKDEFTLWSDSVKKSPDKVRPYNNLGIAYKRKGMYDEAIRAYQKVISIDPDHANAHTNLGLVYAKKGKYEEAIREYHKAIVIDPAYVEAHVNLGNTYAIKGMYDEAVQEFEKALRIKPDSAKTYMNLGIAYAEQGMYDEAIKAYQRTIFLEPDFFEAYGNLGNAYSFMGMYDKAIREYHKALEIKPDFAGAFYNLGSTYAKKDMPDEAIRAYQRAVGINPYFVEAHYKLGTIFYHRKQYDLSARHFKIMERLGYSIPLEFREILREPSKGLKK
ncbi:MAG: tetratricopeptide repeat protein [Deltaproteobacteria bacterium]|nr:MAG: tetratricopeptide repeat protein [Deltaproteobacteria bacterium]